MEHVDRLTRQAARPARRADRRVGDARLADRQPPGARDLRHVRRRLRRPSRPAPDPDARGLRGPPAAPRLPDRRRARAVHPQRRDRARGGRDEHAPTTASSRTRSRCRRSSSSSPRQRGGETVELLTLNIGPHHPATHGVLRLLVTLEGEVVRDLKPIIGYVHTGIEKTAEQKAYWKVIPVIERMDYLSYYFNAMAFCGAVETLLECEVPRARAVPARDPPRAQPDHVAPRLARHERARPRRDLDVLVLLPRARDDPRPLRVQLRPAHAHALLPGRRRDGGHPARLGGEGARVHQDHAGPRRPVRRPAAPQRDPAAAPARRLPARRGDAAGARRDRSAAARRRQPLGPAQGRALQLLRGLRVQDPGRHRRRQLRPLRRAPRRDLRVGEDHRAGARRAARGPAHHRGPQDRAAAAPRAGDLDGGADPPLQARHRGLPRPARRGLLPDREPARRARLLRALGRLLEAGARAHARPELRQPPGDRADGAAAPTSPT